MPFDTLQSISSALPTNSVFSGDGSDNLGKHIAIEHAPDFNALHDGKGKYNPTVAGRLYETNMSSGSMAYGAGAQYHISGNGNLVDSSIFETGFSSMTAVADVKTLDVNAFKALIINSVKSAFNNSSSGIPLTDSEKFFSTAKINAMATASSLDDIIWIDDNGDMSSLNLAGSLVKWNAGEGANHFAFVKKWQYKFIKSCEVSMNGVPHSKVTGRTLLELERTYMNSESQKTMDLCSTEHDEFDWTHYENGRFMLHNDNSEHTFKKTHTKINSYNFLNLPYCYNERAAFPISPANDSTGITARIVRGTAVDAIVFRARAYALAPLGTNRKMLIPIYDTTTKIVSTGLTSSKIWSLNATYNNSFINNLRKSFEIFRGTFVNDNTVPISSETTTTQLTGVKEKLNNIITYINEPANGSANNVMSIVDWCSKTPVKRRLEPDFDSGAQVADPTSSTKTPIFYLMPVYKKMSVPNSGLGETNFNLSSNKIVSVAGAKNVSALMASKNRLETTNKSMISLSPFSKPSEAPINSGVDVSSSSNLTFIQKHGAYAAEAKRLSSAGKTAELVIATVNQSAIMIKNNMPVVVEAAI